MSDDFYDLKDVVTELKAALKPLESLSESMRGLDRSYRVQADIQAVEHYHSKEERADVYARLYKAYRENSDAAMTFLAASGRTGDQRTYDQYLAAHGEWKANMAFTPLEQASARCTEAQKELDLLREHYPALFRVYNYVSKG